ncbi:MAG TPA: WD40 repeat domain-containing protein [Beijerinckiaceae bacterium]|nr:WD40 repeat domain-containing protein [Beijerinckiaceae bacterium]
MMASSLTGLVSTLPVGAHVSLAAFLGAVPVLALSDGTALLFADKGPLPETLDGARRLVAHPDSTILVGASDGRVLVTGGDDGRIVAVAPDGAAQTISQEKGKWIDALAVRADGAVAWSAGKQVRARDPKGEVKSFVAPSSVRGLCFMPKGYRLAVAHYGGVSLWFPNLAAAPERLDWAGSHLHVTVSPDGRFAVSSMQENALHGWRIADKKSMRMTGYPTKSRSLSWSGNGDWLATSGAEACVIWPFQSKDGPMGKGPRECGVRPSRVSQVAFHPQSLVVAIGYEDGFVMLCRLSDDGEILVRSTTPGESAAVSAMTWSNDGRRLLFGTEDGIAGLLDLPG